MFDRIQKLMKERGVNAQDLAIAIGLNKAAVSEWKRGRAKPSAEAIARMAEYFGVTSDYLLGLSDEKRPRETVWGMSRLVDANTIPDAITVIKIYFDELGEIPNDEPMHGRLCEIRDGQSLPTVREAIYMERLLKGKKKDVPLQFYGLITRLVETELPPPKTEQPPSVKKVAEALQNKLEGTALVDSDGYLTEDATEAIVSFVANNAEMLQKLIGKD